MGQDFWVWQATPYTIPLILGAATLVVLVFYLILARPRRPATITGVVLLLAGAIWMVNNALELASTTLSAKLFWSLFQSIGYVVIAPGWLILVLQLTGRERWLTRRNLALLAVVPLATLGLILTNDLHSLYWSSAVLDTGGPFVGLHKEHGVWFWAFLMYAYTLILLADLLLLQSVRRTDRLYRWRGFSLLFASLAALVVNMLELVGLSPFPDLVILSIYLAACLIVTWSFSRTPRVDTVSVPHEAILESMRDSVIVTDAQGRIVELNAAAEKLLDPHGTGVIGHSFEQVWPEWPAGLQDLYGKSEATQEIVLRAGNKQHIFDLRVSPVRNRRRRLVNWVVVLRDVTAYKLVEDMLRQRSAELQSRNRELDAFAHTVAHDLKGPLVAIVGYAETMQRFYDDLSEKQVHESLDTIVQGGRRLSRIIDELLLLTSMRTGKVQMELLDMAQIVSEVQLRLDYLIQEQQAEVLLPKSWPAVLGCGPWVEEIWFNYLNNALKYGGRPPRVELGATVQPDGMVRFWVRDNGEGITREEQSYLFTPFTQLGQVRTDGQGLGLSIVRDIVERLGGDVGVESEVGKGSTFSFTLPAAQLDPT